MASSTSHRPTTARNLCGGLGLIPIWDGDDWNDTACTGCLACPPPPVPVADLALDSQGRIWDLAVPSLDRYASLWECRSTGATATWAHLTVAYGPITAVNVRAFEDAA